MCILGLSSITVNSRTIYQ